MVNFYVQRIKNDLMTIEQVPSLWRARVAAEIEKLPKEENRPQ